VGSAVLQQLHKSQHSRGQLHKEVQFSSSNQSVLLRKNLRNCSSQFVLVFWWEIRTATVGFSLLFPAVKHNHTIRIQGWFEPVSTKKMNELERVEEKMQPLKLERCCRAISSYRKKVWIEEFKISGNRSHKVKELLIKATFVPSLE